MKIKRIMEYSEFKSQDFDVIEFLDGLNNPEVNGFINDLIKSHDEETRYEIIEDILLFIGDMITDSEYYVVERDLKKFLKNK